MGRTDLSRERSGKKTEKPGTNERTFQGSSTPHLSHCSSHAKHATPPPLTAQRGSLDFPSKSEVLLLGGSIETIATLGGSQNKTGSEARQPRKETTFSACGKPCRSPALAQAPEPSKLSMPNFQAPSASAPKKGRTQNHSRPIEWIGSPTCWV